MHEDWAWCLWLGKTWFIYDFSEIKNADEAGVGIQTEAEKPGHVMLHYWTEPIFVPGSMCRGNNLFSFEVYVAKTMYALCPESFCAENFAADFLGLCILRVNFSGTHLGFWQSCIMPGEEERWRGEGKD